MASPFLDRMAYRAGYATGHFLAAAQNIIGARRGRRSKEPDRETDVYPRLIQLGQQGQRLGRATFKPTPRNLRNFSRTVYARRAINAIKDPIAGLDWEIVPKDGVEWNSELKRQAQIVKNCFEYPNRDDDFRSLIEAVIEDMMCGAGAIETEVGGDPNRPLWMWGVDGLSISVFPMWSGDASEARYLQSIGYAGVGNTSQGIMLRDDQLIYIRPNPSNATPFGLGPLEVAFESIAAQLGVGQHARNVTSNAKPSTALYLGKGVDDRWLAKFRNYWRNDVEGQGEQPIIGGGESPEVLKLHPDGDEALFLKYQDFLRSEIAIAFDLSPQNLGKDSDVNRNTAEVAEDRDWNQAIKPRAFLLEAILTRRAINDRLGFSQLRFKFKGLDREDELAQAQIYEIYYQNNLITPNEKRKTLGMEPGKSQFQDMTYADVQVAEAAARGAAIVEDDELTGRNPRGNGAAQRQQQQRQRQQGGGARAS